MAPSTAPPTLPPHDKRWRAATTETWAAWWAGDIASAWTPEDVQAARRLIVLVDDLHRTTDPGERRRLSGTIRTASRDLGLHTRKGRADNPFAPTIAQNRLLRAAAAQSDPGRRERTKLECRGGENEAVRSLYRFLEDDDFPHALMSWINHTAAAGSPAQGFTCGIYPAIV
jgi:hypothetical protein